MTRPGDVPSNRLVPGQRHPAELSPQSAIRKTALRKTPQSSRTAYQPVCRLAASGNYPGSTQEPFV